MGDAVEERWSEWPQLPANRIAEWLAEDAALEDSVEEQEGMGIEITLILMMFTIAFMTPVAVWTYFKVKKRLARRR